MQDKVSWTLNMTKNQSSLHIENKFQRPDLPLLGIEPRSPGSQIQHFINGAERKIPQDNSCSCVSKPHHVLLNISVYIYLISLCLNNIQKGTVCFGRAPH